MAKYKICVYAICKNEEEFVDRWMASMSEADMIVVTDTGSGDNTVARLRDRGAEVYVEEIKPWRFDVARNISLSHVPDNIDICVCTDLDEIFEAGWREKIEASWKPDATMGNYLFNWSLKPDGTPDTQMTYFKVHTKADYTWAYPIHECLQYIGKPPERKVFIDGMILNHYPDHTKSRGSYLPLLEIAVQENPESDRMTYYLGREYMYKGEWVKCIETLKKHLSLPTAWWKDERCASMRWIAKSYFRLNNIPEAYRWYYKAVAEVPAMRDSYIECAQMAYSLEDWHVVYYMTQEALKIKKKSNTYINMGYSWNYTPDDLASISCYHLGLYEKSLAHANRALAMESDNERLKSNVDIISKKLIDN